MNFHNVKQYAIFQRIVFGSTVLRQILDRRVLDRTKPRHDQTQTGHILDTDISQTGPNLDRTYPRQTKPRHDQTQTGHILDTDISQTGTYPRQDQTQTDQTQTRTYPRQGHILDNFFFNPRHFWLIRTISYPRLGHYILDNFG